MRRTVKFVWIAEVKASAANPRKRFDEVALGELANSIHELGIILEPLIVVPIETGYGLVAGERRLRAASMRRRLRIPGRSK